MDKWVLYSKTGNPASDIAKAWLKNNGIPSENYSIFQIKREQIDILADLLPSGAKDLVYPNTFSFSMINPQKKTEKEYIHKIHSGELTEEEIRDILATFPALVISPIITDYKTVLVGYDLEKMVSTFRYVKVKDISMA
ncbi:ArsC/Spx/MgsR family protein [Peribacillus kribbensis]|uniref:ArsC/Spx/MgsR family protein n=1 Tax=Peribacillus kribbensis TaxID=356658 RepID=UPI000412E435|nr:ArsC/Spx/MgsR family protein [Peribacillus kribbensis]